MADTTLLTKVKSALGITGEYQDATLQVYIDEVIGYMVSAGVSEEVVSSDRSAGVIARGVTDLWNYNGGAGKLSEYFYQRLTQLLYVLQTGEIISFKRGDYGNSYPINIEGIEINTTDTVRFTCDELVKDYTGITDNCILLTFTEAESNSFEVGSYTWSLKIIKESSVVTAVSNGELLVS